MDIDIIFNNPPRMYGGFHFICLFLIAVFTVIFILIIKNKEEEQLLHIIFIMGIIMALGEVFKQLFCFNYVFGRMINMWFFPWQLCSMAMYCSLALPFLKGRLQKAVLVFLSTFSLFSAIVALAVPADMMRPQILLAVHGFVYHGLIIAEAAAAVFILKIRRNSEEIRSGRTDFGMIDDIKAGFIPAAGLFLGMASVAEVINVVSHQIFHDIHREPDMFYITPYYPSTQPVCSYVAEKLGILPEIVIYLAAIIMFSLVFHISLYLICCGKRNKKVRKT